MQDDGDSDILDFNFWLTVKLQAQLYAIDCQYVDSIFEITQEITKLPKCHESIVGVINARGKILPIIDLRKMFHFKTTEEEKAEFEQIINIRKEEFLSWVQALKSCLISGDKFSFPMNPSKCDFDKWYDNYRSDNQMLKRYYSNIKDHHFKLHELAHHYFHKGGLKNIQCILNEIDKSAQLVLKDLEQVVLAYQYCLRKMCVVVSDGIVQIGFLVDQIVNAEMLPNIQNITMMDNDNYVNAISHKQNGENILSINVTKIFANVQLLNANL